jgi:hypothetical protein
MKSGPVCDKPNCLLSKTPSLKTECPAKARTGSVVAAGKAGWRPIVLVAIEREIPFQIADYLYVIRRVRVETYSTPLGDARED